jgi:hypothetical protein
LVVDARIAARSDRQSFLIDLRDQSDDGDLAPCYKYPFAGSYAGLKCHAATQFRNDMLLQGKHQAKLINV